MFTTPRIWGRAGTRVSQGGWGSADAGNVSPGGSMPSATRPAQGELRSRPAAGPPLGHGPHRDSDKDEHATWVGQTWTAQG